MAMLLTHHKIFTVTSTGNTQVTYFFGA